MLRQLSTAAPAQVARLTTAAARLAAPRTFITASAATSPLRSAAAATSAYAVRSRQVSSSFSSPRWYSTEPDAKAKEGSEGAAAKEGEAASEEEAGEPLSAAEALALRKELEAKSKEIVDWKDKYLRSVADFRNLQERTAREMKSAKDFAITQFAKDLVDSVDNFDRALAMVPETNKEAEASAEAADPSASDIANLVDGLRMTETVLLNTLKKHGLERFDPMGDKFNPNEHEATFMTPVKDKDHNTVFHTQQKGFKLNGRVLRAAKVGVVNNK